MCEVEIAQPKNSEKSLHTNRNFKHMAAAGRLRNKRIVNHKAKVERLQNERDEEEQKEMEAWFENHDVDNDNKFDSAELQSSFNVSSRRLRYRQKLENSFWIKLAAGGNK